MSEATVKEERRYSLSTVLAVGAGLLGATCAVASTALILIEAMIRGAS